MVKDIGTLYKELKAIQDALVSGDCRVVFAVGADDIQVYVEGHDNTLEFVTHSDGFVGEVLEAIEEVNKRNP